MVSAMTATSVRDVLELGHSRGRCVMSQDIPDARTLIWVRAVFGVAVRVADRVAGSRGRGSA